MDCTSHFKHQIQLEFDGIWGKVLVTNIHCAYYSLQIQFIFFFRKHTAASRCHDGAQRWVMFKASPPLGLFRLSVIVSASLLVFLFVFLFICVCFSLFALSFCVYLSGYQTFVTDHHTNPRRQDTHAWLKRLCLWIFAWVKMAQARNYCLIYFEYIFNI